ncbi:MAG: sialidase family protein [Gammaproteobacteria bacterium]|nr:sialidase family protein [Gammaproteobacteria bacterium]
MIFNRNSIYTIALPVLALLAAPEAARANEPAITWHDAVRIASGDAHVGPWRMNESAFHYVDDPTVAINNRGTVAVAWADQKQQDIFFRRFDNGEQCDQPVNVSRSPDIFSWLPRMVITDDDPAHVYILWQEIVFSGGSHGGEAFFARSTDGGNTFGEPINLSNTEAGDGKGRLTKIHWHNGSLDLTRGPAGNLYAAWTEYEGRLWISRSSNHGKSFTEPVHVAGNDRVPARGPALAVGGDGTVYLAWTVGEDPAADIRFAMSKDQGRSFSEPRTVHTGGGHADAPKLAVDGRDRIHLVYGESPAGAGMPHRYRIRYTRSDDNGTTFSQAKVISDPASQQSRAPASRPWTWMATAIRT